MPRANRSWVEVDPTENWTSVTDPKVRRRLQNRINARAHRRRKALQREEEKQEQRQLLHQQHHMGHNPQLLQPDCYPHRTGSTSPSPSITSTSPSPSPLLGMAQVAVAPDDQSASWRSSSSVASGPIHPHAIPVYPSEIEMPQQRQQQRRYTQPQTMAFDARQGSMDMSLSYASPPPTINLPIEETTCSPPPAMQAAPAAPDALFSWDMVGTTPWMGQDLDVAYAVAAATGFPSQQQMPMMDPHHQHPHQQHHHHHRDSLDVFSDGTISTRGSPSPVPMVPRFSISHGGGVFQAQNMGMTIGHDLSGNWVR